ncbi:MAG: hypothetical protein FWD45_05700 [Coriobacteriia bacterium]|nr:hypothetical protein [Coriobacteriia bacterium]
MPFEKINFDTWTDIADAAPFHMLENIRYKTDFGDIPPEIGTYTSAGGTLAEGGTVATRLIFSQSSIKSKLPASSVIENIALYISYSMDHDNGYLITKIDQVIGSNISEVFSERKVDTVFIQSRSVELTPIDSDVIAQIRFLGTDPVYMGTTTVRLYYAYLKIEYSAGEGFEPSSSTTTDVVKPQNKTWFLGKRSDALIPSIDFPDSSPLIVDGLIPSGTIWPSNDGDAKGIVFNDQEPGLAGALLIKGTVASNHMPVYPDPAAVAALPDIAFLDTTAVL